MPDNAVDSLLAGIAAAFIPTSVFCDDAVLDATVPNWRFSVHGGEPVRAQLNHWFADPGQFQDLRRSPLPGGELVEFTLTWQEHGELHTCHQAHILRLRDGRIESDTAFCGGRWPAPLVAKMAAAAQGAP